MTDSPLLIALSAALLALLALLLPLAWRRRPDPRLDRLEGQLQQLAAAIAAGQAAAQGAIDARLDHLAERVGRRLAESAGEMGKSLGELRERLAVLDAEHKALADLSSQVVGLQDILGNKQARGAFGEWQLEDIVRSLLAPGHYEFQATLAGSRRVDCLLRLPAPQGAIPIDAKFPLEAWRAMREAREEAALASARRDFNRSIRVHVQSIAEKYIIPGETADNALMFLPSEAVYAEILANFRHLIEEAARLRVWIVSPTTLMATVSTMRAFMRDVGMREQAHLIQARVGELARDVERLDERAGKLQRHFEQGAEDLRQIRISTEKIVRGAGAILALELEEARSSSPDPARALDSPEKSAI